LEEGEIEMQKEIKEKELYYCNEGITSYREKR
jgi:hypothetical protein